MRHGTGKGTRFGVLALASAALLSTGCAGFVGAPLVPPPAFVFSDFKAPLDLDANQTNFGSKRGVSEIVNILGLVATGDASIAAAAANGNVATVRHVDYEFFSVLGVYARYRTIVYGD
jgi:hypothetical protein